MWESRRVLARFPRGSWKEGKPCLRLSTLSTAPAFPQFFQSVLGVTQGMPAASVPSAHVSIRGRAGAVLPLTPSTNRLTTAVPFLYPTLQRSKLTEFERRWHLGLEPLKEFPGSGCWLSHNST